MELPKNITQVGETDKHCKIYVEDYVVSYMKQMNRYAEEKSMTIALYGKSTVEAQVTYCFVYGACVIQTINREVRHLSQAQQQEIERQRKKYFPEQTFLGYQILDGEMVEGFYIFDQNSCRYVSGYACFFEKNDTMLAYMLETRKEEAQPEVVEQEKYDVVRKRQEARRTQFEEKTASRKEEKIVNHKEEKLEKQESAKFQLAPLVMLAAVCLIVMTIIGNGGLAENVQGKFLTWVSNLRDWRAGNDPEEGLLAEKSSDELEESESATDDQEEVVSAMSTLVAEDKLADAILEENEKGAQQSQEETSSSLPPEVQESTDSSQTEENQQQEESVQPSQQQPVESPQPSQEPQPEVTQPETPESQETSATREMTSYVIRQGDTLINISIRMYGNDSYVSQICQINNIKNPDNIQIGQKILLP